MAGIVDGQSVNAAQSNAAWLAKNGDDSTTGQLGLANPTTATHGTAIVSSQKQFNSFASALGLAVNQAYDYVVSWASDAIGSENQTFKARIESIVSFLIANTVVLPGTGAIQVPKGDTAERPSPESGMLRYNDQEDEFEGYADGAWGPIGGGGSGAGFAGVALFDHSDSPITVDETMSGKVLAIDTTAGAVEVNMPDLSALTDAFSLTVKKVAGSSNVNVNPNGTDTMEQGDAVYPISDLGAGAIFVSSVDDSSRKSLPFAPVSSPRSVTTFTGTAISPEVGKPDQTHVYTGSSAQTFTGFGTISDINNGDRFRIIGTSDDHTLTIPEGPDWIQNGEQVLGLGQFADYEKNDTLGKMILVGRSL